LYSWDFIAGAIVFMSAETPAGERGCQSCRVTVGPSSTSRSFLITLSAESRGNSHQEARDNRDGCFAIQSMAKRHVPTGSIHTTPGIVFIRSATIDECWKDIGDNAPRIIIFSVDFYTFNNDWDPTFGTVSYDELSGWGSGETKEDTAGYHRSSGRGSRCR
jgi:hypothetical protein